MSEQLATKPKAPKIPVLAGSRGVQFSGMDEMIRFCQWAVASRQFKDIETPEVAFIRLQAGLELGLTPIWALTNIMVVNGRPSVWGDALIAIIKSHPECEDVIETFEGEGDKLTAKCEIRRRGKVPVVRTFSVDDAKLANLWGKRGYKGEPTPWITYPKRMLQMRARAFSGRDAFPDALRGMAVVEEVRDYSERPIQARVVETPEPVLPDEIDLPAASVPVEPTGDAGGEAPEGTNVKPADLSGQDSGGGGQESLPFGQEEEERDEEGNYKF